MHKINKTFLEKDLKIKVFEGQASQFPCWYSVYLYFYILTFLSIALELFIWKLYCCPAAKVISNGRPHSEQPPSSSNIFRESPHPTVVVACLDQECSGSLGFCHSYDPLRKEGVIYYTYTYCRFIV